MTVKEHLGAEAIEVLDWKQVDRNTSACSCCCRAKGERLKRSGQWSAKISKVLVIEVPGELGELGGLHKHTQKQHGCRSTRRDACARIPCRVRSMD